MLSFVRRRLAEPSVRLALLAVVAAAATVGCGENAGAIEGSSSGALGARKLRMGDKAVVVAGGVGLNLRESGSLEADIIKVMADGTEVEFIDDAVGSKWRKVRDGEDEGYCFVKWLSPVDGSNDDNRRDDTSDDGNDGQSAQQGTGSQVGSGSGQDIVDFAKQYLGWSYIYASHTPDAGGFDCSGLTYWTIKNVRGITLTYNDRTQYDQCTSVGGRYVDRSELRAGDLVFFDTVGAVNTSANAYPEGHVAIYEGNNVILHAENESTGIRESNMGSGYYADRYYGACRF